MGMGVPSLGAPLKSMDQRLPNLLRLRNPVVCLWRQGWSREDRRLLRKGQLWLKRLPRGLEEARRECPDGTHFLLKSVGCVCKSDVCICLSKV